MSGMFDREQRRRDRERFVRQHQLWMLLAGLVTVAVVVLVLAGALPVDVLLGE